MVTFDHLVAQTQVIAEAVSAEQYLARRAIIDPYGDRVSVELHIARLTLWCSLLLL